MSFLAMRALPLKNSAKGFTLIELLIVVFIIGLLAATVALSLGDTKAENPTRKEAETLIQAIDFVSEYTVLNGILIGMFITPKSTDDTGAKHWCYHWQMLRDSEWRDLPEGTLAEHCLPEDMQWDLSLDGKLYVYDPDLEVQPPVLMFSPSGESTAVEMALFERGVQATPGAEVQHIDVDLMGNLHWRNLEEEEKRREQ